LVTCVFSTTSRVDEMINGTQYTTAHEDLALAGLAVDLKEAVLAEIQQGLIRIEEMPDLVMDASVVIDRLNRAYVAGRRESSTAPSEGSIKRLQGLHSRALVSIDTSWQSARVADKKRQIDLSELCELLRQAYYLGKEDARC
jgi:hypothetical protein